MNSKIIIKDLKINCIIGERDYERVKKQIIYIDTELYYDATKAIKTDNLQNSVDYDLLAKEVKSFTGKSKYYLIETLASNISDLILKNFNLTKVFVRVKKPSALKGVRYVACEISKNSLLKK